MMNDSAEIGVILENITIGYKGAEPLIHQANAKLNNGEIIALAGRNGAGKTSLLRCLNGQMDPLEGSVRINKIPAMKLSNRSKAFTISYVSAGNNWTENLTVLELVSLGRYPYTNWWGRLREEDRTIVKKALHFVGMEMFEEAGVHKLSDGERQRVMIARALAQDTPILILDEPMAFLDIPNRYGIMEVLTSMKSLGKSILFSTHDIETASRFADKFWVIHDRDLIEGGTEDLGLRGVFNELFQDQHLYFDKHTMQYKSPVEETRSIYLESSDQECYLWTERALQRAGYSVLRNKGETDLQCHATRSNGGNCEWNLFASNRSFSFQTIYALLHYLTRIE